MVQPSCLKNRFNHSRRQLQSHNIWHTMYLIDGTAAFAWVLCASLLVASVQSTQPAKFGIYMQRQPESTVAPLRDEVLFECALSLRPERFEWRFLPQSGDQQSFRNELNRYIYLTKEV